MSDSPVDHDRIALGVQQPWAELIMRGIKTVEVRSSNTKQRGPIYIYSSRRFSNNPLAEVALKKYGIHREELVFGKLLGSVEIVDSKPCKQADSQKACLEGVDLSEFIGWHLENPERLNQPVEVKYLPYGVWFYPFKRKKKAK